MTKNQFEEAYHKMPKNFMTPDVRKWVLVGVNESMKIIELSRGRGLEDEEIWGVSELIQDQDNKYRLNTTRNGQMFTDKDEAEKYYLALTY